MNAYILMDGSGSMSTLWEEAIGSINGYVAGLAPKTKVRVDIFDNGNPWYTIVRDTTKAKYQTITATEILPRGMTPLNDAAGKLLTEVLATKAKKAVVVIMTDGFENCSKEFTLEQVKTLMTKATERGFEVIMLGANFQDVENQAKGYGLISTKTMNMSRGKLGSAMADLSSMTVAYMSGASAGINLDDRTKADAIA